MICTVMSVCAMDSFRTVLFDMFWQRLGCTVRWSLIFAYNMLIMLHTRLHQKSSHPVISCFVVCPARLLPSRAGSTTPSPRMGPWGRCLRFRIFSCSICFGLFEPIICLHFSLRFQLNMALMHCAIASPDPKWCLIYVIWVYWGQLPISRGAVCIRLLLSCSWLKCIEIGLCRRPAAGLIQRARAKQEKAMAEAGCFLSIFDCQTKQ